MQNKYFKYEVLISIEENTQNLKQEMKPILKIKTNVAYRMKSHTKLVFTFFGFQFFCNSIIFGSHDHSDNIK